MIDAPSLQPRAERRRLHPGDRVPVGEDHLAGHPVGIEGLVADLGIEGAPEPDLVLALPALDVLAVELLDHGPVLVAGGEPLVELGVDRRVQVRAVVLDVEPGVGVR